MAALSRRRFLQTGAASLAGLSIGCHKKRNVLLQGTNTFPKNNIILISIDTLRPDHLGCYGRKKISPNIDRFANDCIQFDQHIANAPITAASHASMFTSLIPLHHGARSPHQNYPASAISSKVPTLVELLVDGQGFQCVSYNGGVQMDASYGFGRGFATYESFDDPDQSKRFSDATAKAQRWLKKERRDPFFLFLHTYEVHYPFTPNMRDLIAIGGDPDHRWKGIIGWDTINAINSGKLAMQPNDAKYIVDCYDAEIVSMDRGFGAFMDFLKANDLYDSSIIVFTSDHGEEFGEHGIIAAHGHTLYDELLKLPLMLKLPDQQLAGTIISEQTSSVDLMPTLLSLLGLESPPRIQGVDLIDHFNNPNRSEIIAVSQMFYRGKFPTAVRTSQEKYFAGSHYFDLAINPGETKPLPCDKNHRLHRKMEEIVQLNDIRTQEFTPKPEELEKLKQLGYM